MDITRVWFETAAADLPEQAAVWDAHTHTGDRDPDGVTESARALIAKLDEAGHRGAVVMTSRDLTGYPDANDRILAEAADSDGRLIPFLRVDPGKRHEAVEEAERSLDRGHRGIKLHPRAEGFAISDPTVAAVARVAAERQVPVLIHAGRGMPALGPELLRLTETIPGLRVILAHAAISDLAWIGPRSADHPGVYFDTAWWDITDLLALFAWAPPSRILYASDTPYGHPLLSFTLTMRAARAADYNDDQLAGLFGATLATLLDGRDEDDLGAAPGDGFLRTDAGLLRVHASLHGAIAGAFATQDIREPVWLARLGCEVPDEARHAEVHRAIAATLDRIDTESSTRSEILRPLILAASAALTPTVPVPEFRSP